MVWGEAGHAQGDITLLAKHAAFSFYFLGSTLQIPSPFFLALGGSSASYTEMSHPRVMSMRNLDISAEDNNAWDRNNPTVSKGLSDKHG